MSNAKSRIPDINLCRNLWDRVRSITLGLDERVTDLEESGQENVIEAVSFNGTDVPPDADKRVSLTEQDPTVPAWAKSASKPSYTPEEIGAVSSASGSHTVPLSWSLKKLLSNYDATVNYDYFVAAAGNKELKLRVSRYQDRIEIALINQNNTAELGIYQMLNTSECGYLVSGYRFRKAIGLGDENGLLPITIPQGGTGGTTPAEARTNLEITPANIGALASIGVLTPSAAFSIPAAGNSVSYNMAGMTASHILTHWNFSASPENAPPVDLTWTTYEGYFTITNNGGTTAQTIKPVFELPTNVSITGI